MESIIFTGLQASGKSTFYRQRFFRTHVRINLDMLGTRHRENVLLHACLAIQQPFVVDNTNLTIAQRAHYIALAKAAGFEVTGYFFQPDAAASARRNAERPAGTGERVPRVAIYGSLKKLQAPAFAEGFDRLYTVRIGAEGGFIVESWNEAEQGAV